MNNTTGGATPRKAMVVLSGGQDSTTCLFWAVQQGFEVHAITFDYNQRHRREIQAAKLVAKLAGVASHKVVEVGPLLHSRSPLTDYGVDLETYPDFKTMDKVIGDRVELTFVPMRNPFFLTLAANRAVANDCFDLVTGVCEADNANYPDCRDVFVRSQELCIRLALGRNDFNIHTPLIHHSKAASIDLATKIPGAFEALAFTHTAYDGQYPPNGKDHASTLRAQGFVEANLPDPLVLKAANEGRMLLPDTPNYKLREVNEALVDNILRLKEQLEIV